MTGALHLGAYNFVASTNPPSPNNSSEESLANDESLMFFDDFDTLPDMNEESTAAEGENPKRKSRRPPSTAERRATHNAVERARRESLNGRFMDLAAALPSMATIKRPSKSTIVNKSLEFVQNAVTREQALLTENDALRTEVNELRARLGMPPVTSTPPVAATTKASPRRRQSSLVSLNSADSPLLNGSPLTISSGLDSDALTPPVTGMPSSAPLNTITECPVSTPSSAHSAPASTSLAGSVPGTPAFAPPAGFPMFDMQYLMALSMQQQQQAQSMLKMSGGNPFAFTAPWPTMPMPMSCAPVSTAPDFAANWLFA